MQVVREIVGELVEHDALLVLGKGLGAFEITVTIACSHSPISRTSPLGPPPRHSFLVAEAQQMSGGALAVQVLR